MTVIRPNLPPLGAPSPAAQSSGARAAARAFFELAAGKAPAAAAAPAPTLVNRMAQAPVEPPARPLRPGSLLDIRV